MSDFELGKVDKEVIEKARFKYITNHGDVELKTCIKSAMVEIMHLDTATFYMVFGIYEQDYINYIYQKMNG